VITAEQYQDIQIMQNTDFENTITFTSPHDTGDYDYRVIIAQDFSSSADITLTVGAGLTKTSATVLTMTIADTVTDDLADNYEGVWELVSKKTSGGKLTREIQGDVVVSPGLVTVW
jgi:hypothetical protein